ncbi:MAG: hypothetical protein WCJ40_16020 [Planctomycetota bacterium]|nr:PEP-CTERM sorting domain-containing protein [Planctomycetota bacterium]
MKSRSIWPVTAQLALGLGFWLCVMLGLSQSIETNATDIYVLADVTQPKSPFKSQFGKIDSTTGAFSQISADVASGFYLGNMTWSSAANAFFVTSNNISVQTLRTLSTSGTLSNSIGNLSGAVYGMAYNTADSKLYAYQQTASANYSTINPATASSSVLTTPIAGLGSPTTGIFAIQQGTLYSSQASSVGQFGSYGMTAGSTFQQIGSNDSKYAHMSLASDGTTLYGVYGLSGTNTLYTINPATGALSTGINITGMSNVNEFLGAGAIAVPEPGTCMLALLATAMLAAKARLKRRRAQLA